jgi:DNA-binding response OmpR family regulator
MKGKILLVEDDKSLGYLLREYLSLHGLEVSWVSDGEAGLEAVRTYPFDLCLLDIMMPRKDGYELAREIKAALPDMPLIFLSARSLKVDVLKGFRLGADDYIKKPVDEEELLARIEAVLARTRPAAPEPPARYQLGSFTLDPANLQLSRAGQARQLTQRECDLLAFLAARPGQLCTHADILKTVWGKNDFFNRKSMDVFLSRLRKYLAADPTVQIRNVRNAGFILEIAPSD